MELLGERIRNLSVSNTSKEKAMATHSSTLAWKIPWMEEPGMLALAENGRQLFNPSLDCKFYHVFNTLSEILAL